MKYVSFCIKLLFLSKYNIFFYLPNGQTDKLADKSVDILNFINNLLSQPYNLCQEYYKKPTEPGWYRNIKRKRKKATKCLHMSRKGGKTGQLNKGVKSREEMGNNDDVETNTERKTFYVFIYFL